jgi:hypothetical protein
MVRRHGKKIAIAREEKKKKRERGEGSIGLDGLGPHAPKRRIEEEQRLETHTPGSTSFILNFEFGCIELNG